MSAPTRAEKCVKRRFPPEVVQSVALAVGRNHRQGSLPPGLSIQAGQGKAGVDFVTSNLNLSVFRSEYKKKEGHFVIILYCKESKS